MTWTHCGDCPHVQACAEADGCERLRIETALDDLAKRLIRVRRAERRRRFLALAWRSFYRSFFRSLGYTLPVVAALEWWARHHAK